MRVLQLVLLILITIPSAFAQSESPATVPSSFTGTYTLNYDLINGNGPFSANEQVTLVLKSDNSLCVNGQVLTDPVFRNGNTVEAIWTDSGTGFEYAISNIASEVFNEVNVFGSGGSPFYGQLSGSKDSSATDCAGSSPTPEVTSAMSSIFALAESKLAEFFPAGVQTQFLDQYVYRYYPTTGIYLAFADGNVLLLGGAFGNSIVNAGSTSSVLTVLEDYQIPNSGSTDLWTLSISGSFNTSFIQNIAFSNITLANVPAPDLDNVDEIDESITNSLAGIATGVSSISFSVVENSANRRIFDVNFSATTQAGAVTYNLRYDYSR